MLTKILAGVDETAGAIDAAEFADDVARATDADLLLMTAYQDPLLPFPLTLGGSPTHRLRDAEQLLRTVRPAHAPHAHTRAVPDFSSSRALRRTAESESVALVVLGGAQAASNGDLRVGHTGRQVLHGAPFAVAFASPRFGRSTGALQRIVVGVDGGPEAVFALRAATQLATAAGAEIAASEILVGDPLKQLTHEAQESDLLVLGSRSWGPPGRISLGSTADALCQRSPCSVLIVPRPAAAALLPRDASAPTANGVHP